MFAVTVFSNKPQAPIVMLYREFPLKTRWITEVLRERNYSDEDYRHLMKLFMRIAWPTKEKIVTAPTGAQLRTPDGLCIHIQFVQVR